MKRFKVQLEVMTFEGRIVVSDVGFTAMSMLGGIEKVSADVTKTDQLNVITDDAEPAVPAAHSQQPIASVPLPKLSTFVKSQNRSPNDSSIGSKASLPGLLDLSFENAGSEASKTSKHDSLYDFLVASRPRSNEIVQALGFGNDLATIFRSGSSSLVSPDSAPQVDQLDAVANTVSTDDEMQSIEGPQMIGEGGGEQGGGGDFVSQDVVINADNDNRSAVTYHIPQYYDFERTYSQYETNANGGTYENDLVQLNLATPFEVPVISWGFTYYSVNVTIHGKGRISIWDSPDKKHLIPLDQATTAYMQPDLQGQLRILPSFWVEGLHISEAVSDITVTITTEEITHQGLREYDFKPIHLSVTPVSLSRDIQTTHPYFVNSSNSLDGVQAIFKQKRK